MIPLIHIQPDRIKSIGEFLGIKLTGNHAFDLGSVLAELDNRKDAGEDVEAVITGLGLSSEELGEIRRMFESLH
jgi:hypothetical protein